MRLESFKYQADRIFEKQSRAVSKAVTQSAREMYNITVRLTPHDTYTAQNGWKLTKDRRRSYIPVRHRQPPPGPPTFRFYSTKDNRFYFYNNVPYIYHLEYGTGKTPAHMMRHTGLKHFTRVLQTRLRRI